MFLGDGQPSAELFSACKAVNTQLYLLADFFEKTRELVKPLEKEER